MEKVVISSLMSSSWDSKFPNFLGISETADAGSSASVLFLSIALIICV